jgi:hypothetical protein
VAVSVGDHLTPSAFAVPLAFASSRIAVADLLP